MTEPFYAKIKFKDFISHFRKLTDEQIVEDVRKSMDDMEACEAKGNSFGAFLVRVVNERMKSPAAIASRENGKNGGRPLRLPNWKEFLEFVDSDGLDYSDAREWWEMSIVDRKGTDRDGKPIKNWIAMLRNFCASKQAKRSA